MAALMRRTRSACALLEPALSIRFSNRFVRAVRRRPLTSSSSSSSSSSSFEEASINRKSGVNNEHVEGAEGLEHACRPSGLESIMSEGNRRNVGQKHGDMMRKVSESHHEKTSQGFHQGEGLRYEKAHPDDKRVTRLVNLARSKKLREQQGKILLEGRRLICEALDAGVSPVTIFFSALERLQELPVNKLAQAGLLNVKLEDVRVWAELEAPVDMIAIFKRPLASQLSFPQEKWGTPLPLTLVCDNLRDPGNLGATLRCAAAAGCHSVLLSTGCVDAWEPKVLRAALGAHFRLPVIPNLSWSEIRTRLPSDTTVHVADNSLATESEPAGTPRKKAGDYGWVNSRRISGKMHDDDDNDEDEEDDDDDNNEIGGARQEQKAGPVLKTQPFYTNWTGSHTAVVIGGETHGLSPEALRLAEETRGRRLTIPMVRGVDSLNAAMAASVLLFEGRRQLSERTKGRG